MHGPDDELERGANRPGELWVRPYTATNGRTHPSTALDLVSLVRATGRGRISPERLGYDHAQALRLCRRPMSVAEVAARLKQPANVAKVLLSDLIDAGAVDTQMPDPHGYQTDIDILEAVLAGLRDL